MNRKKRVAGFIEDDSVKGFSKNVLSEESLEEYGTIKTEYDADAILAQKLYEEELKPEPRSFSHTGEELETKTSPLVTYSPSPAPVSSSAYILKEPSHLKDPYDIKSVFDTQMNYYKGKKYEKDINDQVKKNQELKRKNKQLEMERERQDAELRRAKRLFNRRPLTYDIYLYDKIYDWSLGLIPSDYTYIQKKQLEHALKGLIQEQLKIQKSQSDIEETIKSIFKKYNKRPTTKKKPASKTTTK